MFSLFVLSTRLPPRRHSTTFLSFHRYAPSSVDCVELASSMRWTGCFLVDIGGFRGLYSHYTVISFYFVLPSFFIRSFFLPIFLSLLRRPPTIVGRTPLVVVLCFLLSRSLNRYFMFLNFIFLKFGLCCI